jgi:predicted lactoylglutathione lyase
MSEKEVDKVNAAALAAGASPVKKPQPASWGGYSGYFKDLDGYLWEVAFNPFTWIGPEDEKAPNIEVT